jgi:cobalt-zinc-cadmium efflux system outer membrane protein
MYVKILGVVILGIVLSSSSYAEEPFRAQPRPLGKDIKTYNPINGDDEFVISEGYNEPTGSITLRQALSLALIRNPQLKAFSWEVRAREAQALQAGLLPNPELESLLEDFGGTGSVEGFKGTETTILLSQLIPLAGKISKRKKLAALNTNLAGWDYETVRLDVFTNTAKAFTDVLAAQKQLKLSEELAALAKRVYNTVAEQASAGEISPIQERRAKVALSQTEISLARARRELEAARKQLVLQWGSTQPLFEYADGNLDLVLPIPSYDHLAEFISRNPDIARWAAEMEQREAALKLEKAKAIPDPIVSGGYRHISEKDDNAFVVGLSIPLPFFDRNQGNILEARRRISQGEEEKRSAEVGAYASLTAAYKDLTSAYEEVLLLKNEILRDAQSAYESIFEGYREGKFSLLDVLDAQRTVFDADFQYIQALRSYHLSLANLERLTGTPIEEMQQSDSKADGDKTRYQSSFKKAGEIK